MPKFIDIAARIIFFLLIQNPTVHAIDYLPSHKSSTQENPSLAVYYGQLHAHTSLSDGELFPADAFRTAKDNGLDFFAVTDHLESMWIFPKRWARLKLETSDFNRNNKNFVALHGFEWGGVPSLKGWVNHMNFIGSNDLASPFFGLSTLYRWVGSRNDLTVGQFNHPGMKKFKPPLNQSQWDDFKYSSAADKNVHLMRVETPNNSSSKVHHEMVGYIPALDMGWHLGPQSSEDNHSANWGHSQRRTGVWAGSLTSDGILLGLNSMAVFYTDDSNASVKLVANDMWLMGSTVSDGGPIKLTVRVADADLTDQTATVELVTYRGSVIRRSMGGEGNLTAEFWVNPPRDTYFFVRVLQADGDRLVSAPIFVDR